jgi:AcrR family transcriptional regulator
MTTSTIRRTPVQNRSNETLQAILDATARLLTRLPVDQITTSRVAEEAGISVGALYRFFSDKQEIYDAIAVRELERFREIVEAHLTARKLLFSPRKTLGQIIDTYVKFLDEHPHFRVLSLGGHISDTTRESQTDPNVGPGGLLQNLLVAKLGIKPSRKLERRIRIASEVGDRLIAYAYRQPSREEREAVIEELKILLQGYLIP